MTRETRRSWASDEADEAAIWSWLKWARLDARIAPHVDAVEAVDTYASLEGEADRVERYLHFLEERAGRDAVAHARDRARDAARRGAAPAQRRLRVTAPPRKD